MIQAFLAKAPSRKEEGRKGKAAGQENNFVGDGLSFEINTMTTNSQDSTTPMPSQNRPIMPQVLRVSVRTLMLGVLLAAVFLAGFKVGQRHPAIEGSAPRAMEFVTKQRGLTDQQASAVYRVATMLENSSPGALSHNPTVVLSELEQDGYSWQVTFHDPVTANNHEFRLWAGSDAVREFLEKRKSGFKLVAE